MIRNLCNLVLTTVLTLLTAPLCGATSVSTLPTPDDSESRILVSVVRGSDTQTESTPDHWSIDSQQAQVQVIRSDRFTSDPEKLVVIDAARLRQSDFIALKTQLTKASRGPEAKIAWVDDQGWDWVSLESLPTELPSYSKKRQDGFEAAVFLDWFREMFTAAGTGEVPLRVTVFTRDFPVSDFATEPVSTSDATRSLPRQCFEGVVHVLTNQPSRLRVVNFSQETGYLTELAEKTGGSATNNAENMLPVDLEERYVLTLLTSFRGSDESFPEFPVQPVKIQVRNQKSEREIRAPQFFWPLPAGKQPPSLSDLLEAQQLRPRAASLKNDENPIQALVLARRIVVLSPFDLADRIRILELLRSIGNPDPVELERSIDEALALFPDSTELCYRKGLMAEERAITDEAIKWYEKALISDSAPDLHLRLAQLYMKNGRWKRSVECFEIVVGTELDTAMVRLQFARALQSAGASEKALEQVEVAREMSPDFVPIVELEMHFALESKEYAVALDLARNVLGNNPKQPTANFTAGMALTQLGQFEEALSFLKAAESSHFEENFELQHGFYQCFQAGHRLDKAALHLERAANLQPNTPGIWMDLAVLHERRGDRLGTEEALKRGAEENSDDPGFQLSLAEWLERHGKGSEALASLEKALETVAGPERSEIAQRYVLLTLQESGSFGGLKDVGKRLNPELDKELLQMIQKRADVPVERESASNNLKDLVLPGGLEPLLKYAPFLRSRTQDGDLLDLLFGYLLETEPLEFANQKVAQTNPRREEAVTFYREFLRFEKWLRKKVGSTSIKQQITTKESDLEAANQVLSYFGVKVRRFKLSRPTYSPDPDSVPKLEVVVEPRFEKRRIVLKWFGISTNLIGEGSVLQFELKDATLPVLLGTDYWNQNILKVDADRQHELLLRWLKNPKAMKLYRALVRLPAPACQRFLDTLSTDHLLEDITPGLLSMGELLNFDHEGRIILPGGKSALQLWSQLVTASSDNEEDFVRKLFTQDEGQVLYFLASLSNQRSEILEFLLSDPARFKRFYGFLNPPPKGNFLAGRPARNFHDMGDVLGMLRTNGKEIYFPASWAHSSLKKGPEIAEFAGDEELIRSLFEVEEHGSTPDAARKYAMLQALILEQSPLLHSAPERLLDLGALYGLVSDLGWDSALVETLLKQIDSIEKEVEKSDRRTVIALFQAPLVVLRILANNQAVEREKVRDLAAKLLFRNQVSWSPGDVALHVTSVLYEVIGLLEAQYGPAKPLELLLKAFAARHEPISFVWDGKTREIDLASRDIELMRTSLEEHFVPSLDSVLEAYHHLGGASDHPAVAVDRVIASVNPLLSADFSLGYLTDQYRRAIEHTDADGLQSALNAFSGADLKNRKNASKSLTTKLAPYLAEALIALVYIRNIKEDDLVVQTDEHFFRKHKFKEKGFTSGSHGPQKSGGSWGQPILVKDNVLGSQIVGSLVGISRPLARLKAEQLQARSSTRFADSTFPVTQKLAVALVDSLSLTNGALVCIGRTMDLSHKIVSASIVDSKIRAFAFSMIERLCGANRSWQFRQHIEKGDLASALDIVLPSEMLQVGKEYWIRQSDRSTSPGPVETDLAWFFRENPGCIWHFAHSSESPINELGFPLTTFIGVDVLSLSHAPSIEASATYSSPHRLGERSCELKLRMAELFWRMGLPSPLFKLVCDRMLDRVLPRVGQVDREDWRAVTQQLQAVTEQDVQAVLAELFDG